MTGPINPQRSPGFRCYLSANTTATSWNSILGSSGDSVVSAADAATLAATRPIFPMGKALTAQLLFFGTGDVDDLFDYRIWSVHRLASTNGTLDSAYLVRYLGGGLATLGNATVPSTITAIPYASGATGTHFADTLTWTPSTNGAAPRGPLATTTVGWETALSEGTSQVYSPANDLIAGLMIPCNIRSTGLIVDFNCDNSGGNAGLDASSANCMIMTDEV